MWVEKYALALKVLGSFPGAVTVSSVLKSKRGHLQKLLSWQKRLVSKSKQMILHIRKLHQKYGIIVLCVNNLIVNHRLGVYNYCVEYNTNWAFPVALSLSFIQGKKHKAPGDYLTGKRIVTV